MVNFYDQSFSNLISRSRKAEMAELSYQTLKSKPMSLFSFTRKKKKNAHLSSLWVRVCIVICRLRFIDRSPSSAFSLKSKNHKLINVSSFTNENCSIPPIHSYSFNTARKCNLLAYLRIKTLRAQFLLKWWIIQWWIFMSVYSQLDALSFSCAFSLPRLIRRNKEGLWSMLSFDFLPTD